MDFESHSDTLLSIEYERELLRDLHKAKSKRLSLKPNEKGKNKMIWSQFHSVYLDNNKQDFVCCKNCNYFIRYTGRSGNAALTRHRCYKLSVISKVEELKKSVNEEKIKQKLDSEDLVDLNSPMNKFLIKCKEMSYFSSKELEREHRLEIQNLIDERSPRIRFVSKRKGTSGVWCKFRLIKVDGKVVNYTYCVDCQRIVSYMSRTGTGGMTRHKCQTSDTTKNSFDVDEPEAHIKEEEPWWDENQSDQEEGKVFETGEASLTEEAQKLVHEKRLNFFKKSASLMNIFDNDEFLDFAQSLIDLGAICGRVDARTLFKEKLNWVNAP